MRRVGLALLAGLAVAFGACAPDVAPTGSSPSSAPTIAPSGAPASPTGPVANVIFHGATVITMDAARPRTEAVAIAGDRIMAVGDIGEMMAYVGPDTTMIDLGGRALLPGFIDAHQHRIGDGPTRIGAETGALIDAAIAQGFTTIDELYVDQSRLEELRELDERGVLRLRVNAYLPVNQNSPEGRPLGGYYAAYTPGQMVSPHVRVAGLKIFTDFDNASFLLWDQADLSAEVLARHREGWHLAIKTVSARSLAMILEAVRAARDVEPGIVDARVRLEHMLFATPEQIATMAELGIVPVINTNVPGAVVGDASIDALIASEPAGAYAPWQSVFTAGIPAAGMSGFPTLYVDEPTGAPFGSPVHLIWQAVTRAGNLGVRSPESLMGEALTAEQALRAHTLNAAYGDFQDDIVGSIAPGKVADLVVLSADPLTVPSEAINDLDVLMTMIGGVVEHCAAGAESLCPPTGAAGPSPTSGPGSTLAPQGTNLAKTATVSASSEIALAPATNATDGTDRIWNAAGIAPQWIELRLAAPGSVAAIRLTVAQDPGGPSVHELWVSRGDEPGQLVHVFRGDTFDGDSLVYVPVEALEGVVVVRVVTTSLGELFPAWREIEVIGSPG